MRGLKFSLVCLREGGREGLRSFLGVLDRDERCGSGPFAPLITCLRGALGDTYYDSGTF